ncbi:hypothetical protein VTK73DRAFT_7027 [Phialemonium thermophilum]|uniref:Rik1-associated factor 1 n=1 Tax=Phialemonium thermophilum TaxID=223376 RepID=A0ABR3XUP6_9PEZI
MAWTLTPTPSQSGAGAFARRDAIEAADPGLRNGLIPLSASRIEEDEREGPPRKRVRLADQTWKSKADVPSWVYSRLSNCLESQVFPYVDAEISRLRADNIDTGKLALEVIGALTRGNFNTEFKRLGGRVSPQLEEVIALRARRLVREWSKRPVFRIDSLASRTPNAVPSLPFSTSERVENNVSERASGSSSSQSRVPHNSESQQWLMKSPSVVSQVSSPPRVPAWHAETADDATPPRNATYRARSLAWGESDVHEKSDDYTPKDRSRWFRLGPRPYLPASKRRDILRGAHGFFRLDPSTLPLPCVFHVDFTEPEIENVRQLLRRTIGLPTDVSTTDPETDILKILERNVEVLPKLLAEGDQARSIRGRTAADVQAYLADLRKRENAADPSLLCIERDDYYRRGSAARSSRLQSLLLAREIVGHRGYGLMRKMQTFTNQFRNCREDSLELRAEWTNCAGDIATVSWVSNDAFVCGTTEHSDSHNQQYNKPGNLVLGSICDGTLRAYPHHRVVRPIVPRGENSTDAMRQSQDPWLYASVVSSDYDSIHDLFFTSSFDRTVKIWKVEKAGRSMSLLGTWPHGGNVNFVVASKHQSGMVATAADVSTNAVRVYHLNETEVSSSPFWSYSCSRVVDLDGNTVPTDKWAYFPATIQWGLSPEVQHLLLVGYSPRSLTVDDNDIPEDRRASGEICLWDALTRQRRRILSASTQNVFEVLWHPSQPSFIAATSPLGLDVADGVRTQIRVYRISDNPEHGEMVFTAIHTLDCTAADINELTIMPNSLTYCYITAGCTDGKTYVWDTARGDKPIHTLKHGGPLEEFNGDREKEDTGVKFTAWGTTPDRFYTGSSDGVVKVWNVRTEGDPFIRDLLEVPAPVSCGVFSPDRSKLVIGDASGRVFLLSVDENDQKPAELTSVRQPSSLRSRNARRPKLVIPHPEPEPPKVDAEGNPIELESGRDRARAYLQKGQLVLHRNPTIGAVRGPKYAETGLFRREAHSDDDPTKPLLARFDMNQQESLKMFPSRRRELFRPIRAVQGHEKAQMLHRKNLALDLDLSGLPEETMLELRMSRVDLDDVGVPYDFEYEEDS